MISLLVAFGVGVGSALVPFFNVEAYLPVVAFKSSHDLTFLLAATAGAGQTVGKLVWYVLGARGSQSAWLQKKLDKGDRREAYERWAARLCDKPIVGVVVMLASAVVGLPPLLVMAIVAGSVRMSLALFLGTVFVGRTLRFWALLAGVDALSHLHLPF